jgi:general secretion pathway protein K
MLKSPGQCLYRRKGSILIIALWSLFFLSALALVLNAYINPQISLASKLKERAKSYYLAKAGVKKAIQTVAADETLGFDALKDLRNNKEFKEKELGDGIFNIGLVDEERKININKASFDVLKRFFEIAGGITAKDASGIADSIIDWRDADNDARQLGAEDPYYQTLSPPYPCKNKDFEVIKELLLVKGISREIFDKVRDNITVYGQGAVNINTAEKIVLESLGMSDALAEKIIHFRNGEDGAPGTEDDNVFDNVSSIVDSLRKAEDLSQEEINQLGSVIGSGLISVASDNFTGKSTVRLKNRPTLSSITFVFGRDKKIKFWREEWE